MKLFKQTNLNFLECESAQTKKGKTQYYESG